MVRSRRQASGLSAPVRVPLKVDTTYFSPSSARFMVNFRVDDLDRMRAQLKALGDAVDQKVEDTEQSRSGWVMDPDGTRIELWQPAPKPLP